MSKPIPKQCQRDHPWNLVAMGMTAEQEAIENTPKTARRVVLCQSKNTHPSFPAGKTLLGHPGFQAVHPPV